MQIDGVSWTNLCSSMGCLELICAVRWGVLDSFVQFFGVSWTHLCSSLGCLGLISAVLWGVLDSFLQFFGVSWTHLCLICAVISVTVAVDSDSCVYMCVIHSGVPC